MLNICILSQWTNLEKYQKVQQLFLIRVTHLSELFYMNFCMFKFHNNLNESTLALGHFNPHCLLFDKFFAILQFDIQRTILFLFFSLFFCLVFKGKMCTPQTLNYVKIHHLELWLADWKHHLSIFGRKDQINLMNHSLDNSFKWFIWVIAQWCSQKSGIFMCYSFIYLCSEINILLKVSYWS